MEPNIDFDNVFGFKMQCNGLSIIQLREDLNSVEETYRLGNYISRFNLI